MRHGSKGRGHAPGEIPIKFPKHTSQSARFPSLAKSRMSPSAWLGKVLLLGRRGPHAKPRPDRHGQRLPARLPHYTFRTISGGRDGRLARLSWYIASSAARRLPLSSDTLVATAQPTENHTCSVNSCLLLCASAWARNRPTICVHAASLASGKIAANSSPPSWRRPIPCVRAN